MKIFYENLSSEDQLILLEGKLSNMASKALATLGVAGSLAFAGEPNIENMMKSIPNIANQYDSKMKDWVHSDDFDPTINSKDIPGYADAVKTYNELRKSDQAAADFFARTMNGKWKVFKDILPPIGPQVAN